MVQLLNLELWIHKIHSLEVGNLTKECDSGVHEPEVFNDSEIVRSGGSQL